MLKAEVAALAQRRAALLHELRELAANERDRLRNIDLLTFQVEEIEKAKLAAGEEEESARSACAWPTRRSCMTRPLPPTACSTRAKRGGRCSTRWGRRRIILPRSSAMTATLEPLANALESATVQIADVCHELADYRDRTQFDPERLQEVDDRLQLIRTLKRKYGENIDAILAYVAEKRAELDRLSHHEERQDEIRAEIARVETRWPHGRTRSPA